MPFDKTIATDGATQQITDTHATNDAPRLWPIYAALLLFVVAMVVSVVSFGVPGLYLPAVAAVPVIFVLLIWISVG